MPDLRWKYIFTDSDGAFWFYDTKSLSLKTYVNPTSKLSEREAKVWIKYIIPTEKLREKWARSLEEEYKKADLEEYEKADSIVLILNLYEFNCSQREFNSLEGITFLDGEIIGSDTDSSSYSSSWRPIIPESSLEALFNEVCSKKNK